MVPLFGSPKLLGVSFETPRSANGYLEFTYVCSRIEFVKDITSWVVKVIELHIDYILLTLLRACFQ